MGSEMCIRDRKKHLEAVTSSSGRNWEGTDGEEVKCNDPQIKETSSSQVSSETTTNLSVFKCNFCDRDRNVELAQLHASMYYLNAECVRLKSENMILHARQVELDTMSVQLFNLKKQNEYLLSKVDASSSSDAVLRSRIAELESNLLDNENSAVFAKEIVDNQVSDSKVDVGLNDEKVNDLLSKVASVSYTHLTLPTSDLV